VSEAEAATYALATWQANFTGSGVPENLGHQALLVYTKDAGDKDLAPYFVVRGVFNGPEADCRTALEPLFALPNAESRRDIWREGRYRELNEYLLSYPTEMPGNVPASARSLAKSHIVERHLTTAEWAPLVDLYRNLQDTDTFVGLEPYGGAINRVAPDAMAYWHRRAMLDVSTFAFWMYERKRADAESYLRDFDRVLAPIAGAHSYQNYPNRDDADFGRRYFGGNLERLVEVKQRYDPDNLFSFPQGLLHASLTPEKGDAG
jgi:FAD/FMN-containing dehydrogenase